MVGCLAPADFGWFWNAHLRIPGIKVSRMCHRFVPPLTRPSGNQSQIPWKPVSKYTFLLLNFIFRAIGQHLMAKIWKNSTSIADFPRIQTINSWLQTGYAKSCGQEHCLGLLSVQYSSQERSSRSVLAETWKHGIKVVTLLEPLLVKVRLLDISP